MCASVGAFPISRGRQKIRALLHARPGRPLMPDFYFSPALKAWVDEVARRVRPSVVFVSSVAMWPYVAGLRDCGLILDAIDIDSEKWAEYALTSAFPMKLVWAREGRTLLAYERAAAMASDRTFFVSEPETERFAVLAPETRGKILSVENGVDLERFSPTHPYDWPFGESGPCAVFTGTMDYWPNADAVTWFAREILPGLREKVAGLRFWIVGANPTDAVLALGKLPGVTVTGRVSDVRAFVAHAAVIVCPLRIARGDSEQGVGGDGDGESRCGDAAGFRGGSGGGGARFVGGGWGFGFWLVRSRGSGRDASWIRRGGAHGDGGRICLGQCSGGNGSARRCGCRIGVDVCAGV